ncbi:hypothetical protein [Flavobacterium sp. UMI-01]|uniref:hypothetical protein n=1 Tax=Flavobacterium sp. UMI-01 TaxID=1441053 RepID=UPI001C7DC4E4|nr:hypothetical protein [Flavobacterium sp. UMI-01]GIZ08491.1 hypothetical protein FUMI01_12180 [Flavobacterium sp. UMI-01]
MNIDLRNISPDFENAVNEVKKELIVNTNSKAVEHCVVNYLKIKKANIQLRVELEKEKEKFRTLKNDVKNFTDLFSRLNEIT